MHVVRTGIMVVSTATSRCGHAGLRGVGSGGAPRDPRLRLGNERKFQSQNTYWQLVAEPRYMYVHAGAGEACKRGLIYSLAAEGILQVREGSQGSQG